MTPRLVVIDNLLDFKALIPYIQQFDYIAYDSETTGLSKRDEVIGFSICAEEELAYYVILAKWDVTTKSLVYLETAQYAKEFLTELSHKQLIMHNGVFDCIMAESNYQVSLIKSLHTDTMILAHLLDENRRIGLKDLGFDLFGESATTEQREMKASVTANGGTLTKKCYELYKADPYLLGKYGAKDTWLTYKLFMELVPGLYEQGLDEFFYNEESMPLLRTATYDMNVTGLTVDTNRLATLKNTLLAECAAAKDFIYKEIDKHIKDKYPGTNKKNTFNIGSSQQLAWLCFGALKLEFNTLTKSGKTVCKALDMYTPYKAAAKRNFIVDIQNAVGQVYQPEAIVNGKKVKAKKIKEPWAYIQADNTALKKHAKKHKWIDSLIQYQKKTKLLKTYIKGIEAGTQYGVIHPSFLQHGTKSGRFSCKNPNFQNLPRDDQRIKECIVARPGKVFVSADYSQLEPRVFACYSKDAKLLSAFDGASDFYSVIGIDVYDKYDATPQKDGSPDAFGVKYKGLRDISKVIALSTAYGTTAYKLAAKTGKSVDDTQDDMDKYFERFPGVQGMMLEAHELVKQHGYVTNMFGRPRRIPEAKDLDRIYGKKAHKELPYNARKLLNMACNHRIQSTGASIINRAMIAFYEAINAANIECRIVSQIHDELVVECTEKDSEDVVLLLRYCMEETNTLPGVKLEAVPKISRTLAK